jgi:hypothetical protein
MRVWIATALPLAASGARGMVMMVAVVVLLGAAGAGFYLRRRRRTRSEQVSEPPRTPRGGKP